MSKIRVYELAKELSTSANKIASKDIVEKAKELGIPVENHLSQLDETETIRLKKAIKTAQAAESGEVKRVRRSVVRRRRGGAEAELPAPAEKATTEEVEEAPVKRRVSRAKKPKAEVASTEPEVPEVTAPEPDVAEEPEAPVAEEEPAVEEPEIVATDKTVATEQVPEETAAEVPADVVEDEEVQPEAEEGLSAPVEAPAKAPAPAAPAPVLTAVPEVGPAARKAAPLKLTPKRKPKDSYKAVVVAMPEETEAPKVARAPAVRPSTRQLEKEEKRSGPKRKGKKLIYDRRREGTYGGRGGPKSGKTRRKKAKRHSETDLPAAPVQKRNISIEETITVSDLAAQMAVKANLLVKKLVEQGVMATLNDALDYDTAAIIATDLGYDVENTAFDATQFLEGVEDQDDDLVFRPPIVTIMGHVDHGKTSLLDRIQATDIAGGEAGGITQKIGAYVVEIQKGKVVFIDTPGHEAFTAMRARGAQVTDLVILVVAADDGVMPQTIEAVNHARAAGVPIIVAVNKVDKPEADRAKVRRELSEHELVSEEWGGNTIFVDVSAKSGEGVEALLEMLVLQAEILELKANPGKRARGIIIESRLEKGRGPVASVVVLEGTLKIGDTVVAGTALGRVRALLDHRGGPITEVLPSFPAEIVGLDRVPPASEVLYVVKDEKTAKMIADHRERKEREERLAKVKRPTFDTLFSDLGEDDKKVLKAVLKGDSQGSVEAIRQGMEQLGTEQVVLEVIHEGVGVVSENDVNLAMASDGLILGFNVKPDPKAKLLADAQNVQILSFSLIHDLLDKTRALMEGKLEMIEEEAYLGKAEIRQVFSISRLGKIAGSYILDGKMLRSALVRVKREDEIIFSGRLSSLKRFKDDVKEVAQGFECGIAVDNFNDIRVGDIIEAYEIHKIAAKL